jgi:hypothetical protein
MKKVVFIPLVAFIAFVSCKNEPSEPKIVETVKDLAIADLTIEESAPEYLYVLAHSGLTLREFNNLNSEKLAKMPYGTKVKVITPETKNTMALGGIKGGMHEIEFNHKKGFAFNGYLSKFFPPELDSNAKGYAEELSKFYPKVVYSERVGGAASKPINTETLLLPTLNWHEAFFIAQRLFDFPKYFDFPNPKGKEEQIVYGKNSAKDIWTNQLQITRKDNSLIKIEYVYKTKKFGYTVTISKVDTSMKIEKSETVE